MKKILLKKLFADCTFFFLIALICSSSIIWIFQAVNYLDIMIEDGRDYLVYINYTLLNFPKITIKLVPFCIFFSFFYVIYKYEMNNELLIFWMHGVEKIRLINFFARYSIIIVFIQMCLTSFVVPLTQDFARSFIKTSNVNYFENFIKPKKFIDTVKYLTIYTENKIENSIYQNLYLKKNNGKDFQITFAKKGVFKDIDDNKVLVLYDGKTITKSSENITTFNFSQSDFDLSEFNTNTITTSKTQEQSTLFLLKCIKKLNEKKIFENQNCRYNNLKNIYKEIYKRFVLPIFIPILILIPLMLISKSKENIKYIRHVNYVFILGLLVIIYSELSLKYIVNNIAINFIFVSMPVLLFLLLYTYSIFNKNLNFKKF